MAFHGSKADQRVGIGEGFQLAAGRVGRCSKWHGSVRECFWLSRVVSDHADQIRPTGNDLTREEPPVFLLALPRMGEKLS